MNDFDEFDTAFQRVWHTCTWPLRVATQLTVSVLEFIAGLFFIAVTAIFVAVERFEGIEGFFFRLMGLATWPARGLFWACRSLIRRLLPDAVHEKLQGLMDVTLALPWLFFAGVRWVYGVLFVRCIWPWIVWLTQPIWRPLVPLNCFSWLWLFSREYRLLLWGMPVTLLLAPFPIVMFLADGSGDAKIVERYRRGITQALETGDYERSALYERKLVQMGADTLLSDYQTALAMAGEDKLDQAYQRMQQLAPLDRPGYPAAHFWIARVLMSGEIELPEGEVQQHVGIHLAHLGSLGYDGPDVRWLRARWFVEDGRLAEAAELYGQFAEDVVVAAQEWMRLLIVMGDDQQARKAARLVRFHMEARSQDSQPLTAQDYKLWAMAEKLLDDRHNQMAILRRWREIEPENPSAAAALAHVARTEFNALLRKPIPNHQQIAERLHDVVELSSDPNKWLTQAQALYHFLISAPAHQSAMKVLLKSPNTSSAVLHALSVAAVLQQDWETAISLLQGAIKKNPQNSVLWNNYAWLMMSRPRADLEKALAAANKAVRLSPQAGQCRETRGQILVKLGRPQEAISDLTMALNILPNYRPIHRSLAVAYEAVGNVEAAQAHRALSQ